MKTQPNFSMVEFCEKNALNPSMVEFNYLSVGSFVCGYISHFQHRQSEHLAEKGIHNLEDDKVFQETSSYQFIQLVFQVND